MLSQPLRDKAFSAVRCVFTQPPRDSRGLSSHREHSEEPEPLQPRVEPDGQLKHALFEGWRLAPKPQPPVSNRAASSQEELSLLTYNGNPRPPNVGTSMSVSSFVNQSEWSSWGDEEDEMGSCMWNAYSAARSTPQCPAEQCPACFWPELCSPYYDLGTQLHPLQNLSLQYEGMVCLLTSDVTLRTGRLPFLSRRFLVSLHFSSSLCFPFSLISLCCCIKGWILSFKINLLRYELSLTYPKMYQI